MADKRINNGGARVGAGARRKDEKEKKVTVSFQIKRKHYVVAKAAIHQLLDSLNSG